jgi:nitric oxide reductase activation protein
VASPLEAYLEQRLGGILERDDLRGLSASLAAYPAPIRKEIVDLGLLLSDFSRKSASEFFKQLSALLPGVPQESLSSLLPAWVGIGIRVAQKSGAAGIRFFRESPESIVKAAGNPRSGELLSAILQRVEADPSLGLIALKAGSEMVNRSIPFDDWIEAGSSLASRDYTLGTEYFRVTPDLLRFLSTDDLSSWIETGVRLAEPPRYFDTILFYRLSPELFQQIREELRSKLLLLLFQIGEHAPAEVIPFFKEAPEILSRIAEGDRSGGLAEAALEAALQVAGYDGALAPVLLRKTPEILKALGRHAPRFLDWVSGGLSLLAQDPDRARGYFGLATREGREALDRLIGGMSLHRVEGVLKRIASALGGRPLAIRPLPGAESGGEVAPLPKTDGFILYLPGHVRIFPDDEDNFLWYKVAVAHAAGRVEFGSDALSPERLEKVKRWLADRHGVDFSGEDLGSFLDRFPSPRLARDLFALAEGARIDALLRKNYPGLSKDLNRIAEITLAGRMPIAGKSSQEAAVELLLQISLTGKTREPIPSVLQPVVFEACRVLTAVQEAEATVEISLRVACEVYFVLEPQAPEEVFPEGEMERFEPTGKGERGTGDGAGEYRPADPLAHRGEIDAGPARRVEKLIEEKKAEFLKKLAEAGIEVAHHEGTVEEAYRSGEIDLEGLSDQKSFSEWAGGKIKSLPLGRGREELGEKSFLYPEWDCTIEGYREEWCRVRESKVEAEEPSFPERVRMDRRGEIFEIVRLFQALKPQSLRKKRGEEEGEEIDLDLLIAGIVERRAGRLPTVRVYTRRERKERSVAAAILVDLSGSTGRQIAPGRTVLEVEKEGLVLLAEALRAVGDPSAFYGFSGRGREEALFYRIKDFEEEWEGVPRRIGALRAFHQNRDGAAIRHASATLARRPERTKLLILISDGRPLDEGYEGSYAVQDSRKALQEARDQGIHPFCITVDREGGEYLEGIYGKVAYTIIDDVASLPGRLPILYKRLTT